MGRIFNHMIKYFPCETTNIIFYRDMIKKKEFIVMVADYSVIFCFLRFSVA